MTPEIAAWLVGAAVVPSLLVAWAAAFWVRSRAVQWGLVDQPGHRKVHHTPTPMGGGLAIWAGMLVSFGLGQVLLWMIAGQGGTAAGAWARALPEFVQPHLPGLLERSPELWVLLGAATVLMVLGLMDDRRGLDWRLRLGCQLGVAALCVFWQDWRLTLFLDLPLLTGLLSVLWIVALINAFNMLDNMDGLSAGVAAIAASMLAAVLLASPHAGGGPQWFVAGFLLVLVGSLLGFLWHNRPPARLFMGDAGSYFVGFCIGVATLLATYTSYDSPARHAVLAPLCVMAVPFYDMATVLWIRLRERRSPFQADKSHFSHRLVELGLSKGQAVLTIYLTTATCGLGALLLPQVDTFGAVLIGLMVLCVLSLIVVLETTARRTLNP